MPSNKQNLIAPQVRKLRVSHGWSQEELAMRIQLQGWDLSRSGLSKIEAGLRRVNDAEIWAIADALSTSIQDLYPKKKSLRDEVLRPSV